MEKGIIILAKYKNNNSNSSNRSSSNNNSNNNNNNNNNNNTIILIFQQNELSAISFQFSSFKIDLDAEILILRDKTFPPKLFKAFLASADLRSSSALDRENEQQHGNAIWSRLFYQKKMPKLKWSGPL